MALNKFENHKIFVEFLGWKVNGTDVEIPPHLYTPTKVSEIESGFYEFTFDVYDLEFETDYSLIMELVEKIEKIDGLQRFDISKNSVAIEYYPKNVIYFFDVSYDYIDTNKSKIITLYDICLEFILWYNENVKIK
jgi:hypothetical protein